MIEEMLADLAVSNPSCEVILPRGHLAALRKLNETGGCVPYNLGRGTG